MRTCTTCQIQIAYIEEDVEDDEIDRYRTLRGNIMKRKKVREWLLFLG
jgi:hypothetical protein